MATTAAERSLVPPASEIVFPVTGGHGFARLTGDGPQTVVLLHAIGLDGRVWQLVTAGMPTSLRCVAVDLRGFGRSDAGAPTSLAQHADDVAALLDHLGVARAHLVGHSYGGAVAAAFALRHPQRIATLGLLASIVTAPRRLFLQRAAAAESGTVEDIVAVTVPRWFTPAELDHPGRPIEYVTEALQQVSTANWAAAWRILAQYDLAPELAGIGVPTQFVAGEVDQAIPRDQLIDAARTLACATLTVVPGAAHMLPLERPFEIAELISRHLWRQDAR